jgi:AraC-like DNA-binding protein
MLQARFSKPAPGLEPFVRFYVQREARIRDAPVVHPVPARATPMIVLEFADLTPVRSRNARSPRKSPPAVVVGPQTNRFGEMHLQGALETFVIMFQPDGLHRLFSIPMHELTNQGYEAHSVLGNFISSLRECLGNTRSFNARVSLINQLFLGQALQSPRFDRISAAAQRILRTGGRVDIPSLADISGLGLRQFERRFVQCVGMRPKLFARIARFEAALETKARFATRSWTVVAHDFGYYDQMHMVHDFHEFTGITPTETLAQLETVFVEQIKTMRSGVRPATAADSRLIL